MNNKQLMLGKISLVISIIISNCLFIYCSALSWALISMISYFMVKIFYAIKSRYNKLDLYLLRCFYIAFEIIALLYYFISNAKSFFPIVMCIILIVKCILLKNDDIINLNQLNLILICLLLISLLTTVGYTINNTKFIKDIDYNLLFLSISVFFSSLITIDTFNISKKEYNKGYLIGSGILILVFMLENFAFGDLYIFSEHPIIKLSSLSFVSVTPFFKWIVIYMIIIRETILLKYAYINSKSVRRRR